MDKYDLQIQKLLEDPKLINKDWTEGVGLFQFASPDGTIGNNGNPENYGCLTTIRGSLYYVSTTPELTAEIRADTRIPKNPSENMTREQMEIFAKWQRRLDKVIRGLHFEKERALTLS